MKIKTILILAAVAALGYWLYRRAVQRGIASGLASVSWAQ